MASVGVLHTQSLDVPSVCETAFRELDCSVINAFINVTLPSRHPTRYRGIAYYQVCCAIQVTPAEGHAYQLEP